MRAISSPDGGGASAPVGTVYVYAPFGGDARVVCEVAAQCAPAVSACATPDELAQGAGTAALALVVTEEGLAQCSAEQLADQLERQPAWSALPVIVLSGSRRGGSPGRRLAALPRLGNVTVLRRPLSREALEMALRASIRSRMLQFRVRDQLAELERHAAELERRVEERSAALAHEIEERKRAEAALAEARRLESLGRLTGGVAHDFNNLLQVVGGAVMLLRMLNRGAADERVSKALESITRATAKGAALTRQLLAYGARQPLASAAVDLVREADALAQVLRHVLPAHIALEMDLPDGLWPLRADAVQLEAALLNLVINARDASQAGGRILLRAANCTLPDATLPEAASLRGDFVCLSVLDQGEGMSEATAEQAFEPFFTTKPIGAGSGMGLSQVQGFARQSGGFAFIRREAKGVSIHLLLPRAPVAPACPMVMARNGDPAHPAPTGLRVLCVEDEPMIAQLTHAMFTEWGCSVSAAASADEALQADLSGVDLVFSDVLMPGSMDGIALAERLRAHRPELPIVLASGYVVTPERLARLDVGFVQKPYSPEQAARACAQELARMRVARNAA